MSTRSGPAWTATRRASAGLVALLLLLAYGLLTGGVALLWSDRVDRTDGYVWSPSVRGVTDGYAVTSDDIHLDASGVQGLVDQVVDGVRLEVTATDPTDELFVGVARAADVAAYLGGVAHRQVGDIGQGAAIWGWLGPGATTNRSGGPPAVAPGDSGVWLARSTGVGTCSVSWPRVDGDWVVVVMQADGSAAVSVSVRTGASAPHLGWIAGGMIVLGVGLFALASFLIRRTMAKVHSRSGASASRPGGASSAEDAERAEQPVPA